MLSQIHDVAHLDLGCARGITAHMHVSWLHPCKIRRVTVIGDKRMAVYNAIRTGTQPRAHGRVGLKVVQVLAAAQEVLEKQEAQQLVTVK